MILASRTERVLARSEALDPGEESALVVSRAVVAGEDTGATLQEVAEGARRGAPRPESGAIVVQQEGGGPLIIRAILYDFERSPPMTREDVFESDWCLRQDERLVPRFKQTASKGRAGT